MNYIKKIIIVTSILSLTGCAFISIPIMPSTAPLREELIGGSGKDKILVIDISGIISEEEGSDRLGISKTPSMLSNIKEELNAASNDPDIKAVILKIDSPGGTVTASDIIYNEIELFKKKTGKKIIANMMSMATSGGYYIASSADKIVAHPTTITGSIGVLMVNIKIYELMEKIGLKDETVKSGPKKDIISPFRPISEEEKQILQKVIDSLHSQFVQVVFKGRKGLLSLEEIKKIADGRIYTAPDALSLKLIDKIGYVDEAISTAKDEAGIKEALIVRYNRTFYYKNNIYSKALEGNISQVNLLNIEGNFLDRLTPKFMYIWMP